MNIPISNQPRVVIIGGGFGGLNLAKSLRNKPFQVVMLDKNNYHAFQPLLYQVATAGLEPDSIAYPLRKIFKNFKNLHFRMAEVKSVDTAANEVITDIGTLTYDHLVIATGSATNFFGNEQLAKYAMPMKSVPEALNIRSLILQNFEKALITDDIKEREAFMNIVIVGGGPTGVELAGALSELRHHVLPKDYPDLDVRRMSINLIEASPRLLSSMDPRSSEEALETLTERDVQVWTDVRVMSYDGQTMKASNGMEIQTYNLIWAAGVEGCVPQGWSESQLNRGKRLIVDLHSRVNGLKNVYAIGDVASMESVDLPRGHPMLAQVAIQQGKLLASNLLRLRSGKDVKAFAYKDLGSMATIGRNKAVVDMPAGHFKGFGAWVVWMIVHVMQLIGFRNKMLVILNWFYNYLIYARDIRLIIRKYQRP
ncbi:MAG: NAD(P)/FAD-dependent oxidoreductase [Cryomorphaceae bacterium]|nr:NAD(P)/FAD-dependent oxidoreductase [Cryomorphaceae bacterium]